MQFLPYFDDFESQYQKEKAQFVWCRIVADLETPVSIYLKASQGKPNNFLLESVEGGETRGRYSIIGIEPDIIFEAQGQKARINKNALKDIHAFEELDETTLPALSSLLEQSKVDKVDELPPMASGIYGYLGYETIGLVEDIPKPEHFEIDLPDIRLLRPTITLIIDSVKNEIIIVTTAWYDQSVCAKTAFDQAQRRLQNIIDRLYAPLPRQINEVEIKALEAPKSNTSKADYMDMVKRAKEYISAGDIFQVVLSQRFSSHFPYPPFSLYRALRRTNPAPFLFYLCFEDAAVVGSSPEILVRVRDEEVTIRPIAGTRKRGKSREEDLALEQELLSDPKECAEHLMLLDLGRNDVGRVSELKSVKVTSRFFIERYSHVMHIVSNVIGKLKSNLSMLEALYAGFPAGTVSGAPKIRAMEIIAELEATQRGVYGGCVGYFSSDGNMDTCIALRTAVVKEDILYVSAGAGIVADSDPESEYNECVYKSRALFAAAQDAPRYLDQKAGSNFETSMGDQS